MTFGEEILINLRFNVTGFDSRICFQFFYLNFVIEVTDVTNDRLVLHFQDMIERNDVAIAGGGHVDVAAAQRDAGARSVALAQDAFGEDSPLVTHLRTEVEQRLV